VSWAASYYYYYYYAAFNAPRVGYKDDESQAQSSSRRAEGALGEVFVDFSNSSNDYFVLNTNEDEMCSEPWAGAVGVRVWHGSGLTVWDVTIVKRRRRLVV